jgi:acyl-CoA thioester hydrolase
MFVHEYQKRIRYGETDQMGYLYYGHYPLLYEIGRTESIRDMGISYRHLENEMKIMMPVLYTESKYVKPVYYDELITIRTILDELPTKMISYKHEILNEAKEIVHYGVTKLFFIDMLTNKRVSAPAYLTDPLKDYFNK